MSGKKGHANDSTKPALPTGVVLEEENSDQIPLNCRAGASDWQVLSATVRGAAHRRSGEPNQDALSWWMAEGKRPVAVLCMADGHGGSEYTRSDIGALLAVEQTQMLLVSEILPLILSGSTRKDLAQFNRHFRQQLPKLLVKRWRASVYEHATDNPVQPGGQLVQSDAPKERLYGATLLAALLTPEFHLYIQLGDGDMLTVSSEGEVTRPPFPADSNLIANHTTSLCSKEAWRFVNVHFQQIDERPPTLVMLTTDGYANSFANDSDFKKVARDLHSAIQQEGSTAVAESLPSWLEATSQDGSGDDISIIIATANSQKE